MAETGSAELHLFFTLQTTNQMADVVSSSLHDQGYQDVCTFTLEDATISSLLYNVFANERYYTDMLLKQGDTGIEIEKWSSHTSLPNDVSFKDFDITFYARIVDSEYVMPLLATFPFIPSKTENRKVQMIFTLSDESTRKDKNSNMEEHIVIKERVTVKGIPMVDPILVLDWNIVQKKHTEGQSYIDIDVKCLFLYDYDSWLKNAVEYNGLIGLQTFYTEFEKTVVETLAAAKDANTVKDGQTNIALNKDEAIMKLLNDGNGLDTTESKIYGMYLRMSTDMPVSPAVDSDATEGSANVKIHADLKEGEADPGVFSIDNMMSGVESSFNTMGNWFSASSTEQTEKETEK